MMSSTPSSHPKSREVKIEKSIKKKEEEAQSKASNADQSPASLSRTKSVPEKLSSSSTIYNAGPTIDRKNSASNFDHSSFENEDFSQNIEDQLVTKLAEKYSIDIGQKKSILSVRNQLERRIKDGQNKCNNTLLPNKCYSSMANYSSLGEDLSSRNTDNQSLKLNTGSVNLTKVFTKEYFSVQEMEYDLLLTHTSTNPLNNEQKGIILKRIEELKKNLKNEESVVKEINKIISEKNEHVDHKYLNREKHKSMGIINNIKLNLDKFTRLSSSREHGPKSSSEINNQIIEHLNILGSFLDMKSTYLSTLKRMVNSLKLDMNLHKTPSSMKEIYNEIDRNTFICKLLQKSCAKLKEKLGNNSLYGNSKGAPDFHEASKYTKYSGEVTLSILNITMTEKVSQKGEPKTFKKKSHYRMIKAFKIRRKNNCEAKFYAKGTFIKSSKIKINKSLDNVKLCFNIENCDFIELYIESVSVPIALAFIKIEDAILLEGFVIKIALFPRGTAEVLLNFKNIRIHNNILNTGIFRRHRLRRKIDRTKIDNFFADKEEKSILALSRFFLSSMDVANQKVLTQDTLDANLSSEYIEYLDTFGGKNPFAHNELNLDKKYSPIALINKGFFGKLFLIKSSTNNDNKKGNDLFALKSINKYSIINKDEVDNVFVEKKILQISKDFLFIINLIETCHDSYHLFFILEYCSGGDLISLIIEKPFLKEQVLYYSAVALSCLDFLHNESIIYRDLKLDNICLKHDGTPRLVDFGLSKVDIKLGAYTNTFCGTYVFLPPEMFLGPEYNHTLDYWQLGSLIYTMKYRSNPFIADTDELLAKEICNSYLKFPNDDDPLLNDIILCLMKKNPEERLGSIINKGALGVKKHAYFSTINWMKLGSKDCHIPYIPTMKDEYGLNNFPSCSKHKASSSSNIDSVQQNIIAANEYLFENF